MSGLRVIWSIEAVEEELVACHELWRRSPGGGRWPFAGDGPWHLAQGEAGDYAGEGTDGVSHSGAPRTPLRTAEVDHREAVTAWLAHVADPLDRRIVHLATRQLWRGEGQVPFTQIGKWLGSGLTRTALARRYKLALAVICCRLNGWPARRAKALLGGEGLAAEPAPDLVPRLLAGKWEMVRRFDR